MCGPDAHQEIAAYIGVGQSDQKLEEHLGKFRTMYPYLKLIAESNGIADAFNPLVVDAYWIGNKLLDRAGGKELYDYFSDTYRLKRRVGAPFFSSVTEEIRGGALPHHSFHVFGIWKGAERIDDERMLETMDSCRIGWGRVVAVSGPFLTVETRPLVLRDGMLALGEKTIRRITRQLNATSDILDIVLDDMVTMHWGVPCEVISAKQARSLERYTELSISVINKQKQAEGHST